MSCLICGAEVGTIVSCLTCAMLDGRVNLLKLNHLSGVVSNNARCITKVQSRIIWSYTIGVDIRFRERTYIIWQPIDSSSHQITCNIDQSSSSRPPQHLEEARHWPLLIIIKLIEVTSWNRLESRWDPWRIDGVDDNWSKEFRIIYDHICWNTVSNNIGIVTSSLDYGVGEARRMSLWEFLIREDPRGEECVQLIHTRVYAG